jgi:2-C-methyl-D-erythritol 4-phosphate cytidylyltransferase
MLGVGRWAFAFSSMLTAIIVAAGSSRRMGIDKLFAKIAGKLVLAHVVDAFERADCVTEIVIVARKDRLDQIEKIARDNKWKKVRSIVAGGERRQDSVFIGLSQLGEDVRYVAVHDAARPLITPKEIGRVFRSCRKHGGAALAEPVTDTLKRANVDFAVADPIDRNGVYAMQTPQIFETKSLKGAYRLVAKKNLSVTDEVSAVELLDRRIVLVPAHDFNFKMTFPRDLPLAEFILKQRAQTG